MLGPPAQESARPSALSDDELIERWLLARAQAGAKSRETERAYRREVARFRSWAAKPIRHVTYGDLSRFVRYLGEETSLRPSSVARALAALRSLFDFAIAQGILRAENPTRMVAAPRRPPPTAPALLAPARVQALLRDSLALPLRDRLLLLSVVVLGCRGQEAGALRWGDFVLDPTGQLGVTVGAGGPDQRVVAVPDGLTSLLLGWRRAQRVGGAWDRDDRRYIFGSTGRRPLSAGAVRRVVGQASRRLLGRGAPSLHLLRLSGAALALSAGQEPARLSADWDLGREAVGDLIRTTRRLEDSTPLWIWPEAGQDRSAGL